MPLEPLAVACPRCRAAAGQKCRNYAGRGCAPHRDRLKAVRPQDEHYRQAERKAERERARVEEQLPLFADQVQTLTPAQHYDRTRLIVARETERWAGILGAAAVEALQVQHLRRLAAAHLGADQADRLHARIAETWPPAYWRGVYADLLTGARRLALRLERIEEPGGRVRVEERDHLPPADWRPPFTRADLAALLEAPPPADQAGGVDPLRLA